MCAKAGWWEAIGVTAYPCQMVSMLLVSPDYPSTEAIDAAGKAIWEEDMENYDDGTDIKYRWSTVGEWVNSTYQKKARLAIKAAKRVDFKTK